MQFDICGSKSISPQPDSNPIPSGWDTIAIQLISSNQKQPLSSPLNESTH